VKTIKLGSAFHLFRITLLSKYQRSKFSISGGSKSTFSCL